MERCKTALLSCQAQLTDLRALVKSSSSYREAGAVLLSAASDAVGALENQLDCMPEVGNFDAMFLSQANNVLSILDRAEAVVKVYGQLHGIEKIISKNSAPPKFAAIVTELKAQSMLIHASADRISHRPIIPEDVATAQQIDMTMSSLTELTSGDNDQSTSNESLERKKLRKGSRQDLISGLAYGTATNSAWWFISRVFGSDRFAVHDVRSGVEQKLEGWSKCGPVTCIHIASGIVWTGHRGGAVMVWDETRKRPLCSALQTLSGVRAITTDENGAAWVGGTRGEVACIRFEDVLQAGAVLGKELTVLGTLHHSGSGSPEVSATNVIADPKTGMVQSLKAKEKAHDGPTLSVAAAGGRVWTSGGSAAFVCLREWTQRGEFINKHDLRAMGAATCMVLCSPIVQVLTSNDALSSVSASAEVLQAWQLITSHGNGMLQIWGTVSGLLRPLIRIGERASPITSLVVTPTTGLLCSSHLDGTLTLWSVPHPRQSKALTITYADRNVGSVVVPVLRIPAHKTGTVSAVSSPNGVITASSYGSVVFWPEPLMQQNVAQAGFNSITSDSSRSPLLWYDSITATQAAQRSPSVPKDSLASSVLPIELQSAEKSFHDDASRWMLRFSDISLIQKIGEGAFGQVFLGRWHQTDVAVKMLTSLEAVGLAAQSVRNTQGDKAAGGALRTLEREVGIMVAMRHPNIILFMGLCPDPPCVVTEFCSKGSLYDLLLSTKHDRNIAQQLDWGRRLNIALDAAKGMLYLHKHNPPIIHRDLKSPNILCDRYLRAKITDFNLSRITDASANVQSSLVASNPRWLAPEVIKLQLFTKESDIYAFGLILWELATWEIPFAEMTPFQIMLFVGEKSGRPGVPDAVSPLLQGGSFEGYSDYVCLMTSCWSQNPSDRPTFDQIISALRSIASKYTAARKNGSLVLEANDKEGEAEKTEAVVAVVPHEEEEEEQKPAPATLLPVRSPFDMSFKKAEVASNDNDRQGEATQPAGKTMLQRLRASLTKREG